MNVICAGSAQVFKYFDSRQRLHLGKQLNGLLIGQTHALFDSYPMVTVETDSYCNVGCIFYRQFKEIFHKFPEMKKSMMDEILWNPYDKDRDQFIKTCQKHVAYF